MEPIVTYRTARSADIPAIQRVEVAAGERFSGVGMPEIAADKPPERRLLSKRIDRCQLWVAVDQDDAVIGYCMVLQVDGVVHLDQVSVDPDFAGHRIGSALISIVSDWAASHGVSTITLFTFENVPWNAPYYRKLGFRDVELADLSPGLAAIWEQERAADLGRWERVALARKLAN